MLRRISHLAAHVADVDPTVVGEEDHGHAEADQTEKADEARFGRLRGAAGGGGGEEQAAKDQRDEAQDLRHGQEDLRASSPTNAAEVDEREDRDSERIFFDLPGFPLQRLLHNKREQAASMGAPENCEVARIFANCSRTRMPADFRVRP